MVVYDTATKLASEIKSSKEYRNFKKYMKEVKSDKDCEELLKNYRIAQIEIQNYAISNQKMDKISKKKIEDLQSRVAKNKKLNSYLNSELKFTQLMENINRILAQAVEKDYE